jgi:hypothetical protein
MNEYASSSVASNIAANMRSLCEHRGSIADICRGMKINRQQFNKYLAGSALPNPITLRKFCKFFSISEEQLFLEPETFKRAMSRSSHSIIPCLPEKISSLLYDMAVGSTASLQPGQYYVYYPWLRDNAKTLRALLIVRKHDGALMFRRVTRFAPLNSKAEPRLTSKHGGVIFERHGTIFLVGLDGQAQGGLSFMSFGRSAMGQSGVIVGLALVTSTWGEPIASRVTLVRLPSSVTLRQSLSRCGLIDLHSNDIDSVTRDTIAAPNTEPSAKLFAYSPI